MMNSEQKHTDFSLYTFEDFLQTDEAKVILEKAGFTINK